MPNTDDQILGYSTYGIPILDHSGIPRKKNGLKRLFTKGGLIRSNEIKSLISSSVFHQEVEDIHLRSMLTFSSGSPEIVDTWHKICPPFVPHFHPYINITNLDNHSMLFIGSGSSVNTELDILSIRQGGIKMWEWNETGSIVPVADNSDFPFGAFKLSTIDTINTSNAIATTTSNFVLKAENEFWIETRFSLQDQDKSEWAFGVCEQSLNTGVGGNYGSNAGLPGADPANGKDLFLIRDPAHTTTTTQVLSFNGTDGSANNFNQSLNADNQLISLGLHWDGVNMNVYKDVVSTGETPKPMTLHYIHTGSHSSTPTANSMRVLLYMHTSNAAVETMTVEYIRVAIKQNHFRISP